MTGVEVVICVRASDTDRCGDILVTGWKVTPPRDPRHVRKGRHFLKLSIQTSLNEIMMDNPAMSYLGTHDTAVEI